MKVPSRRMLAALLLGSALVASAAAASPPAPSANPGQNGTEDPLAPLARLVGGQWRGTIKLLNGTTIHARHVFEWGLGGKILRSKTYGAFGENPERLVYEGFYTWHPQQKTIVFQEVAAYGATDEGTIEPEGTALHYRWSQYSSEGVTVFKETLLFPDNDHYISEAFKKTEDGWEKFTAESSFHREPLEAEPGSRVLYKEASVDAPLAEVWKAWTTNEGLTSFFGPGAHMEATPGGPFEIYFSLKAPEGLRGSEGCKVHSIVLGKLLAFEWNQPPTISALRGVHTLVTLRFEELAPNRVRVAMTHSGWGVGEDWDKAYAYFDRAWDAVLGNLRYRFAVGPVDWPEGSFRAAKIESEQP